MCGLRSRAGVYCAEELGVMNRECTCAPIITGDEEPVNSRWKVIRTRAQFFITVFWLKLHKHYVRLFGQWYSPLLSRLVQIKRGSARGVRLEAFKLSLVALIVSSRGHGPHRLHFRRLRPSAAGRACLEIFGSRHSFWSSGPKSCVSRQKRCHPAATATGTGARLSRLSLALAVTPQAGVDQRLASLTSCPAILSNTRLHTPSRRRAERLNLSGSDVAPPTWPPRLILAFGDADN
jgi:hypothetical protein